MFKSSNINMQTCKLMNHMCSWRCCIQFSNFWIYAETFCWYLYAKVHTLWSRDRTKLVWKYFRKQEYLFYKRKLGKWSVWSSRAAFNRTAVEFLWSFQTLPYWCIKFSILKKNQLRSWQFYRFAYSRQYSEYTSAMAQWVYTSQWVGGTFLHDFKVQMELFPYVDATLQISHQNYLVQLQQALWSSGTVLFIFTKTLPAPCFVLFEAKPISIQILS